MIKSKNFIPVNEINLSGNEKKYVDDCIKTNWISSEGSYVSKFEENFSSLIDKKYAVAVSSGTAALQIAFDSLNLKKGDEVILPSFTIVSCLLPIIRLNLKPIFIDSDLNTWNMNVSDIENKITKKTKVILVSHIYGLPTEMTRIVKLAKKNKIFIIEDSAEAHGLKYNGKYCGWYGDISIFSFYANKLITTGEGGMLLTNNKKIFQRSKSLRNLFFGKSNRFKHDDMGWNYRMTNIQAAIGCAQLEKLNQHVVRKKEIGNFYLNNIKTNNNFQLPLKTYNKSENVYWVFGILLKGKFENKVKYITNILNKKFNIGTRPFFWPLHKQPILKNLNYNINNKNLLNAEYISKNGFYIPSGIAIKNSDIKYISNVINYILGD